MVRNPSGSDPDVIPLRAVAGVPKVEIAFVPIAFARSSPSIRKPTLNLTKDQGVRLQIELSLTRPRAPRTLDKLGSGK